MMTKSIAIATVLLLASGTAAAPPFSESVLFYASFDRSADADQAKGDKRIYTAESLERKEVMPGLHVGDAIQQNRDGGRNGGALHFKRKTKELVFFKAGKNVPYREKEFAGTVSFWMRLSPKVDLPEGFVDPLQITDKKWNDASFFVDFDQAQDRDFRLGVFADYQHWNPNDKKFDDIPIAKRPMVSVKDAPFDRDRWTHVAFTWTSFNSANAGKSLLYLNGKPQGGIEGRQQFTWDPEKAAIMLGINYVGWIDELAIYDRALSLQEIKILERKQ